MSQIIDAIYEEGVLKPLEPLYLREHAKVRIQFSPVLEQGEDTEKDRRQQAEEILALAKASCEGLSDEELAIMESARIDETHFFSSPGSSE